MHTSVTLVSPSDGVNKRWSGAEYSLYIQHASSDGERVGLTGRAAYIAHIQHGGIQFQFARFLQQSEDTLTAQRLSFGWDFYVVDVVRFDVDLPLIAVMVVFPCGLVG